MRVVFHVRGIRFGVPQYDTRGVNQRQPPVGSRRQFSQTDIGRPFEPAFQQIQQARFVLHLASQRLNVGPLRKTRGKKIDRSESDTEDEQYGGNQLEEDSGSQTLIV